MMPLHYVRCGGRWRSREVPERRGAGAERFGAGVFYFSQVGGPAAAQGAAQRTPEFRDALLDLAFRFFLVVDLRAVDVEAFSAGGFLTGGASLMIGTVVRRASAVITAPRGALAALSPGSAPGAASSARKAILEVVVVHLQGRTRPQTRRPPTETFCPRRLRQK